MEEFDYEELRIATDNFSPSRIIGRGSHGCVYNGNLMDGRTVAVKKLSSALQIAGDNSKLDNEVSILSSLSPTIKLINIVRLLGFSRGSSPQDNNNNLLIVMEFMPNGSLHDLLHDDTTSTAPISTWPGRVRIATQIARAVQFLHGASIVHRDVKSSNVLFDREWTAKLSDFGLALRLPSTLPQPNPNSDDDRETPPAGTIGYLDPSYVEPSNFSTKNDVFSFGALLLEIFSRRKAFDVSKSPPSLVDWAPPLIKSGCSLDKICDIIPPDSMRDEIKRLLSLAARCVSPHQRDRPSMDEVVVELEICSCTAVVVRPVVAWPLKWTGFLRLAHVMVMRKGRMTWKTMTVRRSRRRTVPADTVAGIVATTTTSTNISTSLKCSAAQQIEYVHKHKGMMLKDFLADVCNVDIAVELN